MRPLFDSIVNLLGVEGVSQFGMATISGNKRINKETGEIAMQDYINVLTKNYANFEGRARRREYWMFLLCNILVSVMLMIADGVLAAVIGFGGLSVLYMLAVIIPGIAVTIRRLHDVGKSGWWILLGCVPVVGIALLVFMLLDSEPGDNAWGRNPKGITSVQTQSAFQG